MNDLNYEILYSYSGLKPTNMLINLDKSLNNFKYIIIEICNGDRGNQVDKSQQWFLEKTINYNDADYTDTNSPNDYGLTFYTDYGWTATYFLSNKKSIRFVNPIRGIEIVSKIIGIR